MSLDVVSQSLQCIVFHRIVIVTEANLKVNLGSFSGRSLRGRLTRAKQIYALGSLASRRIWLLGILALVGSFPCEELLDKGDVSEQC